MSTQYMVVQFGDLFRGEFLNIGVFAWDTDPFITEVKSKFITNIDRHKAVFGFADPILVDILENWIKKINNKSSLEQFVESCDSPYTSLQVTPPRGSLEPVDQLLEGIAKTFLVE